MTTCLYSDFGVASITRYTTLSSTAISAFGLCLYATTIAPTIKIRGHSGLAHGLSGRFLYKLAGEGVQSITTPLGEQQPTTDLPTMSNISTFLKFVISANSRVKLWYLALKRRQNQPILGDLTGKTDTKINCASGPSFLLAMKHVLTFKSRCYY